MKNKTLYEIFLKRIIDFFISLIALLLLFPLLLVTALLVRIKLGSPVIFKQERPGKDEKIFTMYKFRTMRNTVDEKGRLLPDNLRLTNFGKLLRSLSVDELPSLINILKGDMSLVGPRPLAVQYLPFYTTEERMRHNVRPGLTGLAQVNGRNNTNWEDRFMYDLKYVNKITFLSDLKIIWLTFIAVIKRKNIGVRGVDSPVDFDIYRKGAYNNENTK